jgi:NTE family protein
MIGLALSGGGSRAMAFHLGCLRALQDLGILERVRVLSTISGGSLIGAYYAYTPDKSFSEFEDGIRHILEKGLQRQLAYSVLKPWNLVSCASSEFLRRAELVFSSLLGREPQRLRYPTRSDLFHRLLADSLFGELSLSAARRNNMDIVIGATELRAGTAFRFSNTGSGTWRHGLALDSDESVAFAVAASAAYPLLLPGFDRRWRFRRGSVESTQRVLLTDGGVYDNLGLSVLEPGRSHEYSAHVYPCEHLIVCSAGHGQGIGTRLPLSFYPRVAQSFDVVHRRVQDSAMRHLHTLRETGLIKGFAMPYLGQQDAKLPIPPRPLVPRSDVIGYPTDFAPMSAKWIDALSSRGEQLTRALVPYYLGDIL